MAAPAGFRLYRKHPLDERAVARDRELQMELVALLTEHGPLDHETIRNKLGVASSRQYDRICDALAQQRVIEPLHGGIRLVGDTRYVPAGDLDGIAAQNRRRAWHPAQKKRRLWSSGIAL